MKLHMNLDEHSYDIILERGCLKQLRNYIDVNHKILIISDDNVPREYIDTVAAQCPECFIHIVKHGEQAKSLHIFEKICDDLLKHHFSRKDKIIALGGGVVGDLSGYVAASYMRGIDFIQIPTTTLSQIDSSIGGKVAINFNGVKNVIGAFYQPKLVLIDPNTLKTLPRRHYINGLVEALKAGLIYDASLFEMFENKDIDRDIDEIIAKALAVKKAVVEQDEKEQGLRKILNFGHTIGHAIEADNHLHDLYHGECVALGMPYFMSNIQLRERTQAICKKIGLPSKVPAHHANWLSVMRNDKKADHDKIDTVWVHEAGQAVIKQMSLTEIAELLEDTL